MPITLPETLPAFDVLRNEGVMVMSPERAARQDIRPLRIALLNLMPKKIQDRDAVCPADRGDSVADRPASDPHD